MAGTIQNCCRSRFLFETILPIFLSQRNAVTRWPQKVVNVGRTTLLHHESRSLRTSTSLCKIFEIPSRKEVEALKQLYPNPKHLMEDLLQPLVHSGLMVRPRVAVMPRLGGRFFRAKLQLTWPGKVTVSAVHHSVAGAEESVYLLACDLLKNMGLLYQPHSEERSSMAPVNWEHVLSILHILHSTSVHPFSPAHPQLHCTTSPSRTSLASQSGSRQLWRTQVAASWPYCFDVSAVGPSLEAAEYAAGLYASIKLKALGLLSNTNHLVLSRLQSLARRRHRLTTTTTTSQHFDPHYQIFSDASARGFGAYLVDKDHPPVHWLSNAWSEHFPGCPHKLPKKRPELWPGAVHLESTFCELYAVVTACFTWKHKFVGKRVLVWTDSLAVADVINWGLSGEGKVKRWGKLYTILADTCRKYNIELRAKHLCRDQNRAADLLSRCDWSAFKEVVPQAKPSMKKTKKLLFWNPLQLGQCSPEMLDKLI